MQKQRQFTHFLMGTYWEYQDSPASAQGRSDRQNCIQLLHRLAVRQNGFRTLVRPAAGDQKREGLGQGHGPRAS